MKTKEEITRKTIIGFAKLNSIRGFETPVWINSEGLLVYRAENGLCDELGSGIEIMPSPLIDAAPELLEVLEHALAALEDAKKLHPAWIYTDAINASKEALSKAKK